MLLEYDIQLLILITLRVLIHIEENVYKGGGDKCKQFFHILYLENLKHQK